MTKKGKRECLKDIHTRDLVKGLKQLFESKVRIPGMRMGNQQELEALINEEALLFARYLRTER